MTHIGVGWAMRKVGMKMSPDFVVSKPEENGEWTGNWKMETISTFKTTVVEFKEGVEFDETTADDRVVKTTITFDGEKMIHSQVDPADAKKNTIIERFVKDGDTLVTTCKCGDVEAERIYKKKEV